MRSYKSRGAYWCTMRILALLLAGFLLAACDPSADVYRAFAFNHIAAAQFKAGRIADAKTTAAFALEAANWVDPDNHPGPAFGAAAAAQARTGDVAGALATAMGIEGVEDRAIVLIAIALAQAEAGDDSGARRTAGLAEEEIDGAEQRDDVLPALAWVHARLGNIEQALDLATQLDGTSEFSAAATFIAYEQAQSGNVMEAHRTIIDIEDVNERASALRMIALGQAQSGDFAGALRTARIIPLDATDGNVDNKGLFHQLRPMTEDVFDLWGVDACRQGPARVAALRQIAWVQATAGDAEGARRSLVLADDALGELSTQPDLDEDLLPRLLVLARAGDVAGTRRIVEAISDPNASASAWSAVVAAEAIAGETEQARRTADAMAALVDGGGDELEHALLFLPVAHAWAGNVAEAIDAALNSPRNDQQISALQLVVLALTEQQDFSGAVQAAWAISDPEPIEE